MSLFLSLWFWVSFPPLFTYRRAHIHWSFISYSHIALRRCHLCTCEFMLAHFGLPADCYLFCNLLGSICDTATICFLFQRPLRKRTALSFCGVCKTQPDLHCSALVLIHTDVSYLSTFPQDAHSFLKTLSLFRFQTSIWSSAVLLWFKPLPSYVQVTSQPRLVLWQRPYDILNGLHNVLYKPSKRSNFVFSKQAMISSFHWAVSSILFLISDFIIKAARPNPTSNVFHKLRPTLFKGAVRLPESSD